MDVEQYCTLYCARTGRDRQHGGSYRDGSPLLTTGVIKHGVIEYTRANRARSFRESEISFLVRKKFQKFVPCQNISSVPL